MENSKPQAEMPKYQSHKIVHALKLKEIVCMVSGVVLIPEDDKYAGIKVTEEWATAKNVKKDNDPGYYVVYEDGYVSWSPTKAFEEGYTRIED